MVEPTALELRSIRIDNEPHDNRLLEDRFLLAGKAILPATLL